MSRNSMYVAASFSLLVLPISENMILNKHFTLSMIVMRVIIFEMKLKFYIPAVNLFTSSSINSDLSK